MRRKGHALLWIYWPLRNNRSIPCIQNFNVERKRPTAFGNASGPNRYDLVVRRHHPVYRAQGSSPKLLREPRLVEVDCGINTSGPDYLKILGGPTYELFFSLDEMHQEFPIETQCDSAVLPAHVHI